MKFSGAKGIVVSRIKNEFLKIGKPTNIGNPLSTSIHTNGATSVSRTGIFVNRDLLSHKTNSEMKLPAIYTSELLHNHSSLGNHYCSNAGHISTFISRHFCSVSRKSILDNGKPSQCALTNKEHENQKAFLRDKNVVVFRNHRRFYLRPTLDSRNIGSISLIEIKKFLRQKMVDFKETHACLCLR